MVSGLFIRIVIDRLSSILDIVDLCWDGGLIVVVISIVILK